MRFHLFIFKDQCAGMVAKGNSCNKLEKRKVMGYKAMHQIGLNRLCFLFFFLQRGTLCFVR